MFENIKNNPVMLTEAIRQVLYVGLAFELLQWTDSQLALVLSALSAVLSIFIRSNTISTNKLEKRVTERVAQRDAGL